MKTTVANTGFISIHKALTMSAASLVFATILGFSALVRIPLPGTPVPVTLQTFALLAGAGILRRHYAMQMVGWYLLLGLVGAPFFAGGSGLAHMMGASGGYLLGFVLATYIVGFFSNETQKISSAIFTYVLAAVALFIPGVVQLKLVTGTSWQAALSMGFYPFIVADLAKAVLAAVGVKTARSLFAKYFI